MLLYDMTCLQHLAIGHNRISWWWVRGSRRAGAGG